MSDHIEKTVELKAAPERVWRALTDHQEFGSWFKVALDQPFVVGERSTGQMTYPGAEEWRWEATVIAMEPQRRFAFTWTHPERPDGDYLAAPRTTVEFLLEPLGAGTRLTVIESGFDALPDGRGPEALRRNTRGWEIQLGNIRDHVGG